MKLLAKLLLLTLAVSLSFNANAQSKATIENLSDYSYEQKYTTFRSLGTTLNDRKQERIRKNRELLPSNYYSASMEKLNLALEHLKRSKLENLEMLSVAKDADLYGKDLNLQGFNIEHGKSILRDDKWIDEKIVLIEGILESM